MPATPVYIICSPRPQVGKTLLSRLLSEFLLLKNGNVTAFDINLKEPSLLDYLPAPEVYVGCAFAAWRV